MSIFNKSKLRIRKETEGEIIHVFANYSRLSNKKNFIFNFIRELARGYSCLFVIDFNYIIKRNREDGERIINELTKLLESRDIQYDKLVTAGNAGYNFMGFMIKHKDAKRENNYIVGFTVTAQEINKLRNIIDKYNSFCYIDFSGCKPEEFIKSFNTVHGNMEELSRLYEHSMFNDSFIGQVRINAKRDRIGEVEEILRRNS